MDWIRAKKVRKYNLKGVTLLRSSLRMRSSYIYSSLSKAQGVLSFSLKFHLPFFMEAIPLYSLLLFDLSLPLFDYVDDLLDVCPIRTLL